ncbi:MAG: ComEC/Rec2 family competence protein [Clostridia bacterium]|nr:ComEC/Rec2 family competence protein [Clostridia bacterium]MDD4386727.1 ComEC/Rec2 family competence protein [Clostridia bacterium]
MKERINLHNFFVFNILNYIKLKSLHKYINKHKYLVIIITIVLIITRIIFSVYLFNYKYTNEEYNKNISLLILSKEKQTETYISYLVKIKEEKKFTDRFILNIYKDKNIITQTDEEIYYMNYSNFKYGDIVKIKGKIVIPKSLNNLHEFDYKKYLNSKNIVATIMTYEAVKEDKLKFNILTYIYKFRENLESKIDSKLPYIEANLFKSMIYGDDSNLDEDIKISFTKLGLSHLLAVSGSNVGIVILIFTFIFKKFKTNKVISFVVISIFIFVFCAISEFEISVIRASIISIIYLLTSLISIKLNVFFSIILAIFLIIIYNPFCIFNISFILSFSAFIGIILFNNQINSLFEVCIIKIIGYNNVKKIKVNESTLGILIVYKLLKLLSMILSLYFSVQILILPIQIYIFNSFTFISILSNIVIYVVSTIQLMIGFLFLFLCQIPYISDVLSNLNYLILWIIIKIVNILMTFNIMEISLPTPNFLTMLCYYVLVIFMFYGYKIGFYFKYKFKNINTNLIIKMIFILCIMYIIYFNIYTTYFLSFTYYFNVEQGNMSLIKSGNKVILIDMGTTGKASIESILESFLNAYNIQKIDFFIVTHLHSDHISGLFKLEEKTNENSINIESVIYSIPKNKDYISSNNFTENSVSYLEFENLLNRLKIKQIMVEKFDKIMIDKNTIIHILNPRDREIIISKDKVNSNSIIAMISIKNSNFLFMGDSTIESEKVMLDDIFNLENNNMYIDKLNNIQALQIGHHGSNTSTSDYLLKNINTKLSVISSKKSVYGHPSYIVEDILKKYNIETRITEKNGGLMVKY